MRPVLHSFLVVILSLFCGLLYSGALAEVDETTAPRLPESLSAGPGKMVMLDFYSPYCNTCILMEPFLEKIKSDAGDKIVFHRLDMAEPTGESVASKLGVDGTPAYFLFDDKGNLVYSMHDRIMPLLLRPQVLRVANAFPVSAFPANLPALHEAKSADYTLVTISDAECTTCEQTDKYLTAMEFAEDNRLKIVRLNPSEKGVKQFMEDNSIENTPSYVLYDQQAHELLRLEGDLNPQVFWQYYTMLTPEESPGKQ